MSSLSVCPPSADLLLAERPALQVDALIDMLNDVMAPAGLTFEDAGDGVLSTDRLHVILSLSGRLPDEHLELTDSSEYGQILGEDWDDLILRHRAALTLVVAPGSSPDTVDEVEFDADQHDLMLAVAHVSVTYLTNDLDPLAVHWAPTGNLFTPQRIMAMADMLFPLPLFVHPVPSSTGRTDGETQVVGFRLRGANDLIGSPLVMREAPARLDWLVSRALAFVDHARTVGRPVQPGESWGCEPGERFDVSSDPETGGLALTLKEREGVLVLQPLPIAPQGDDDMLADEPEAEADAPPPAQVA